MYVYDLMGSDVYDRLQSHVFVCNVHKGVMEESFESLHVILWLYPYCCDGSSENPWILVTSRLE